MKSSEESKFSFIALKVIPNAPKDAIVGWEEERLRVKIRAVPEKGRANQHLIKFLAEQLKIAPSRLSLASGEISRLKRVRIEGLTEAEVRKKLGCS